MQRLTLTCARTIPAQAAWLSAPADRPSSAASPFCALPARRPFNWPAPPPPLLPRPEPPPLRRSLLRGARDQIRAEGGARAAAYEAGGGGGGRQASGLRASSPVPNDSPLLPPPRTRPGAARRRGRERGARKEPLGPSPRTEAGGRPRQVSVRVQVPRAGLRSPKKPGPGARGTLRWDGLVSRC